MSDFSLCVSEPMYTTGQGRSGVAASESRAVHVLFRKSSELPGFRFTHVGLGAERGALTSKEPSLPGGLPSSWVC